MKNFKEEDFQVGDVFENRIGAHYEVVAINSVHMSVKYTYRGVILFCHRSRKSFEYDLNAFNSRSKYPFYKIAINILEIE